MNLTEKIVDAYLNGAKIYIFTNGESLEKYKYGLKFDNAWEFTVYVRFTTFVLKSGSPMKSPTPIGSPKVWPEIRMQRIF